MSCIIIAYSLCMVYPYTMYALVDTCTIIMIVPVPYRTPTPRIARVHPYPVPRSRHYLIYGLAYTYRNLIGRTTRSCATRDRECLSRARARAMSVYLYRALGKAIQLLKAHLNFLSALLIGARGV